MELINLVTGGTGLVGSHVILHLLKNGQKVRAMYRCKEKIELVKAVFAHYGGNALELANKIDWVEADILDVCSLEEAGKGVQHIYHTAAMVSFNSLDKEELYKINIEGTANVVNMALEQDIRKFCHVSSTAAIGLSNNGKPTNEGYEWKKEPNTSSYSISKYCAEQEVWRGIEEGLNAVIVNPCIILGPGQINQSSGKLFEMVAKGLKFYTKGSNAFVDVRDVAQSMFELMESPVSNDRFLVTSENLCFQDFFGLIAKMFNKKQPHKEAKRWMSEILWRISLLQSKLTGKKPWMSKNEARSAFLKRKYTSEKILQTLENFQFTPVEKAIENTTKFILAQKNNTILY